MTAGTSAIRELNDTFRKAAIQSGTWLVTCGVEALGPMFVALAILAVKAFDEFDRGNDPHGEHDFGSVSIAGETLFWKIDYYDLDLRFGSEDPADAAITKRVITIMLASEY